MPSIVHRSTNNCTLLFCLVCKRRRCARLLALNSSSSNHRRHRKKESHLRKLKLKNAFHCVKDERWMDHVHFDYSSHHHHHNIYIKSQVAIIV